MTDPRERMALTDLCDELAGLRAECAEQPEEVRLLLTRIEKEARARKPVLPLLRQLLGDDATSRGLGSGLPGFGGGLTHEERYSCPDGACDREAQPVPAGPVPHCLLTGAPMKRR